MCSFYHILTGVSPKLSIHRHFQHIYCAILYYMHNHPNRVMYRFYTIYSIYVIYFNYVALYIIVLSIMCMMRNRFRKCLWLEFLTGYAVLHLMFECHVIYDRWVVLWWICDFIRVIIWAMRINEILIDMFYGYAVFWQLTSSMICITATIATCQCIIPFDWLVML